MATEHNRPRLSAALTLLLALVILVLTLTPPATTPPRIPHLDKLWHLVGFAALVFPASVLDPRSLRCVLPAGLALGLAIELIQPGVGRDASALDFVADAAGLGLGAWLGLRLRARLAARRPNTR